MADRAERAARMALACVVEAGDLRIRDRLRAEGAEAVWASVRASTTDDAWSRRAALVDLASVESLARRHGLRFVVPSDPEWPSALADLDGSEPVQQWGGAPLGLWVKGSASLAELAADAVAVVGCRASTAYGERVATELAAGLAEGGTTVVSGGAFGIDAAAHRGALAADGPTLAVMAGGLDRFYPSANTSLLEGVAEHGLVIAESPPGTPPSRRRFLTRNRIIAALGRGLVVVEATARSGARNTANWATTCFRPVMAVPGPVSSSTSYTPHWLIREGQATLVTGLADVREIIAPMGEAFVLRESQPRLLDLLDEEQAAVYEALPSRGSRDTGEVALDSGLSLPATLAALEELRARGLVASSPDGGWRLGVVQDRPLSAQEEGGG